MCNRFPRFWLITRHNGRVRAGDVIFHQYLWVTKLCSKFGRSRIAWMAIADNSVIVFVKGASPFAKERGNTKHEAGYDTGEKVLDVLKITKCLLGGEDSKKRGCVTLNRPTSPTTMWWLPNFKIYTGNHYCQHFHDYQHRSTG